MNKGSTFLGVVVMVFGLVAAAPSFAHHSFSAEFDSTKCRDFAGTFTSLDWQNPHAYFTVDVKDAGGKVETWTFQTYSLITLKRGGTGKQHFLDSVGKAVKLRGCLAKNGDKNRAAAATITLSDGKLHYVGQDVEGGSGD